MQGSIPIQQVAIIILHFRGVCQVYFSHTSCAVYIPQAKAWGFDGRALSVIMCSLLVLLLYVVSLAVSGVGFQRLLRAVPCIFP